MDVRGILRVMTTRTARDRVARSTAVVFILHFIATAVFVLANESWDDPKTRSYTLDAVAALLVGASVFWSVLVRPKRSVPAFILGVVGMCALVASWALAS